MTKREREEAHRDLDVALNASKAVQNLAKSSPGGPLCGWNNSKELLLRLKGRDPGANHSKRPPISAMSKRGGDKKSRRLLL